MKLTLKELIDISLSLGDSQRDKYVASSYKIILKKLANKINKEIIKRGGA